MSVSAVESAGVSVADWLMVEPPALTRYEVVEGMLVTKVLGGNPHHYLARRLADTFEQQWVGTVATVPGNWALVTSEDGRVLLGRVPHVLVDGDELLRSAVFTGAPLAAVEVWSPGNTLAEMNTKRSEYRAAGLPVLLEAFLTDTGDVHLEWLVNTGTAWRSAAAAIGETPLSVDDPRPFTVVPNDLVRRPA